jgi:hypothetical protein
MFIKTTLIAALCLISSSAAERTIDILEDRKFKGKPDKWFKLGKQNQKVEVCAKKCINDPECVGMMFKSPDCGLIYSDRKIKKKEGFSCGKVSESGPEPVPVVGCENSESFSFGSYTYKKDVTVRTCDWLTINKPLVATRKDKWCDYAVSEGTEALTVKDFCPLACSVCEVEEIVSTSPPVEQGSCILEATLKFPFGTDFQAAPYYGYHADYMTVKMVGDDYWECSWAYSTSLPEWCTYANSDPNGDSAYVASLDDYYYDESDQSASMETIVVSEAAGNKYTFNVAHWFFDKDYYPGLPEWKDHMMAAVLRVNNLSNTEQGQLKAKGWQHPTDLDTSTHIKKNGVWKVNPAYQGAFVVTVDCDDSCTCTSEYKLVSTSADVM